MENNLPILYEDADVVAVAKPSGLLTFVPSKAGKETAPTSEVGAPTESVGAEDWFKEHYPTAEGGYVHRLDRDTSGVLVFAKNTMAYEFLRKAFHDREVKKMYLAFVYGVPKEKKGTIDFDIGRSRKDFRLRSAQPKAKGRLRDALTRYEVIGEVEGLPTDRQGYALMKLNPETGRTHQIRVHLKAIHHPIIGDPLYAPNHPPALGITRLGLHAYSIDVPLPSGRRTVITAPIPKDLAPAFSHFKGVKEKFALA